MQSKMNTRFEVTYNNDRTEGRGPFVVLATFDNEVAAKEFAKEPAVCRKYQVMGCEVPLDVRVAPPLPPVFSTPAQAYQHIGITPTEAKEIAKKRLDQIKSKLTKEELDLLRKNLMTEGG